MAARHDNDTIIRKIDEWGDPLFWDGKRYVKEYPAAFKFPSSEFAVCVVRRNKLAPCDVIEHYGTIEEKSISLSPAVNYTTGTGNAA